MKIKDDGKSFQAQRVLPTGGSKRLRLFDMREWLEMVGGRFDVESAPVMAPPSLRKFRSTRPCEEWIVDVVRWNQT
jgi:hypothetical protein